MEDCIVNQPGIHGDNAAAGFWDFSPLPQLAGLHWFSVSKRGDETRVSIHGEIGIGEETVEDLIQAVGPAGPITLNITSVGGDTRTALLIYMKLRQRIKLATIRGQCFSAAVDIALSASKIRIEKSARMMVHRARSAVFGDQDQIQNAANMVKSSNAFWGKIYLSRCPESADWFNGSDHYFSADEALACGLVDEVFEDPASAQSPGPDADPLPTAECYPPTPDESLFQDFLRAFGPITVCNRNNFIRNVAAWAAHNSTETTTTKEHHAN